MVEVGAVVRWSLLDDYSWIEVAPSTAKKFWTGKGNASKQDMLFATWDRYESQLSDDEADATALAAFGLALAGHGLDGLSRERRAAVETYKRTHSDLKIET